MSEGDVEERGTWGSQIDFLLSIIGYAVGLGNVWRFPYLAYRNGGASFLFPYVIMLIIAGIPLFFIELAVGQFTSQGPMTAWQMAPLFAGIGYGMVMISAIVSVYYNMIIAYATFYMFISFVSLDESLPWEECGHEWNTPSCRVDAFPDLSSSVYNDSTRMELLWGDLYNRTCVGQLLDAATYSDYNMQTGISVMYNDFMQGLVQRFPNTTGDLEDLTHVEVQGYRQFRDCRIQYSTASQEYFERFVLQQHKSPDIGDLGDISLKLVATLLLCWILVFACLMKGIKTSGKVVYFTATFPYAVLIVLLIRGLTLEGYEDGVKFYIIPDWDKLTDATIWGDAATQIFYSLGIGFGGLLTMASYNGFNHNCYRDAIMVPIINCGTSIFAGFAIFSLLGHMAHVTNQDVADVATSGPGLAFIAYPDGISRLPGSPIWAFLFFFMLLTLGLDSQFAGMEAIISAITDIFPHILRKRKTTFTLLICFIFFLAGIPLATHGGIRVLTLINDYSGSYNLLVIAMFEIIALFYTYGISNFRSDIEMMIGFKPSFYWTVMWLVITPLSVTFIVIVSAVQYEPSGYDGQQFPGWAEGIGWVMVAIPILLIFIVGAVQFKRYGYPDCIKPTSSWGPALDENRIGRYTAINPAFVDDKGEMVELPSTVSNDDIKLQISEKPTNGYTK